MENRYSGLTKDDIRSTVGNQLLFDVMDYGLRKKAGSKTYKHFINNEGFISYFAELGCVCDTIEILGKTVGEQVKTSDGYRSKESYKIPTKLKNFVNSRYVYYSSTSSYRADRIDNSFEKIEEFEAMSPEQFNRFFDLYNDLQGKDKEIKVSGYSREEIFYSDIKYLINDDDTKLYEVFPAGKISDDKECQMIGMLCIGLDSLKGYMASIDPYSIEALAEWLLS